MQIQSKRRKEVPNSIKVARIFDALLEPQQRAHTDRQWFVAVARGREAEVAKLLAADPTLIDAVNQESSFIAAGSTALHIAAYHGFDNIVALLLAARPTLVDSPLIDETGSTALHVAAGRGHDKVLEVLLAAKSSVDATDFDGCTALHHAAKSGTCRVVERLLAASPALLDAVDEDGCTTLLHAIKESRQADIVNHLLALNPKNLDATDASGLNVVHHAVIQNKEALVWRLLEMRPDLVHRSGNGITPLCMALRWNERYAISHAQLSMTMKLFALSPQVTDIDKVRLLQLAVEDGTESGLDVALPISTFDQIMAAFRAVPNRSRVALLRGLVAQCGPLLMVLRQDVMGIVYEYLFGVNNEGDPCAKPLTMDSADRMIRWFEAAQENNDTRKLAQLLAEDPTLIDAVHWDEGLSALHFASNRGHHNIVEFLLAEKPSLVDKCDQKGNTALHHAALEARERVVELLLAASPTSGLIANFEGTTALMDAASNGHLRVVELLLAACPGALDLVDKHQCTALLHASISEDPKVVSVLLAANPQNFEAPDLWEKNVLHHEILHGCAEHVDKILAIAPSLVRTLTADMQTPLWMAVNKRTYDNELIEKLFVLFPQAVRIADDTGRTPYHLAVQRNNNEVVVNLFLPKLTCEEIVRGLRCHENTNRSAFSRASGVCRELRSHIDMQCKDAVKVIVLEPVMDTVYAYLGFSSPHFAQKRKAR